MRRYATFTVADRYLGVPVERVQEVLRAQPVTPVPLAHDHVDGLVNLRGHIVTAIDLRARLGLARRDPDAASAHVIVTSDDGLASLVVDALGDVVAVDGDLAPPPETLAAGSLIKGVHPLDDALLLDLDLDATLDLPT